MILADTNVVSEFMRDAPAEAVVRWAAQHAEAELTISVVTVEEVERGLLRLPDGQRRTALVRRWDRLVSQYERTIVRYDVAAARTTARILVEAERAGRPMSLADAQIAGCAVASGAVLATRNVADFATVAGLAVVDPFDEG